MLVNQIAKIKLDSVIRPKNQLSKQIVIMEQRILSKPKVAEVELKYRTNVNPQERAQIKSSESAFRIFLDSWNKNTIEYFEEFKVLLIFGKLSSFSCSRLLLRPDFHSNCLINATSILDISSSFLIHFKFFKIKHKINFIYMFIQKT